MGDDKNIVKLVQGDISFYSVMGPIFGSREMQRITNDRFYDDAGKTWYTIPGIGTISVKAGIIKNVWANDQNSFCKIVNAIVCDYPKIHGVSPARYTTYFQQMGFSTDYASRNFINIMRV